MLNGYIRLLGCILAESEQEFLYFYCMGNERESKPKDGVTWKFISGKQDFLNPGAREYFKRYKERKCKQLKK